MRRRAMGDVWLTQANTDKIALYLPTQWGYRSAGRAHRSQRWRLPFSPFACLHLSAEYGPKRSNSGLPGELPQQFFRLASRDRGYEL